ncbi:hypothetical protein K7432_009365 [Basidiobolus ranarum]|uniref:Uncharacterized protein n=1 Tax=Basidiobolus ranarum TaxID=34480 RepID=A0ABR2VY20_9FUNG
MGLMEVTLDGLAGTKVLETVDPGEVELKVPLETDMETDAETGVEADVVADAGRVVLRETLGLEEAVVVAGDPEDTKPVDTKLTDTGVENAAGSEPEPEAELAGEPRGEAISEGEILEGIVDEFWANVPRLQDRRTITAIL